MLPDEDCSLAAGHHRPSAPPPSPNADLPNRCHAKPVPGTVTRVQQRVLLGRRAPGSAVKGRCQAPLPVWDVSSTLLAAGGCWVQDGNAKWDASRWCRAVGLAPRHSIAGAAGGMLAQGPVQGRRRVVHAGRQVSTPRLRRRGSAPGSRPGSTLARWRARRARRRRLRLPESRLGALRHVIEIVAPGRSQRRVRRRSGRGSETQPFVACPVSSCRNIAEPRPGTVGRVL